MAYGNRRSFGYRRKSYAPKSYKYSKTNRTSKLVGEKNPQSWASRVLNSTTSTFSKMSTIAKAVGVIKTLINVEKKYKDTPVGSNVPDTGLYIRHTGIAQGDTSSNRNGNSILGQYMTMKYSIQLSGQVGATATNTLVRHILFVDKEFENDTYTTTDILEANNIMSNINMNSNSKRFVFLKDEYITVDSTDPMALKNIFVKIPFHIRYDGSTGGQVDGRENQIISLFLTDQSATENYPYLSSYSRVVFTDN